MRVPFLELAPAVREIRVELDAAYARVMERGQFLLGEELAGFEREFAAFCGARDCVGVASGLDALTLSLRALDIVEAIVRDPFTGIGKPEPLKYLAPGTWSRRLTQEHRIVYLVRDDRIDFLQARYHY